MAANEIVPPEDVQGGEALPSDVEVEVVDTEASHEVMGLLNEHVPLALLADLAIPSGPESPQILQDEGLPDVAWWEGGEHEDGDPTAGETSDSTGASVAP